MALMGVVSDGTADTGVRVNSVIFFQLALLEAVEDDLVLRGGGCRSGMEICGRAFFSRCRAPRGDTLTKVSIVRLADGLSRNLRALVFSSLSFLELGYAGCEVGPLSWKSGLLIGPVQSVVTVGLMGRMSDLYSLTSAQLKGLGVGSRSMLLAMAFSMVRWSRRSRSGLRGGGPGLSDVLCG